MSEKDFRVLLDVSDLYLENFKYIWINVSPYELKTIYDLKKCILHKINLKSDIELFVRNGLLLDDETIGVLRENDTVQIKFKPPVCQNLETESLKETANCSRKRNLSEINISNENISLKRHKPGFITLSSIRNEDNFSEKKSEKKKRIKQTELTIDPEYYLSSTSVEGENQTCKKKKYLIESDVTNENTSLKRHKSGFIGLLSDGNKGSSFKKNSKKEKSTKQAESPKDPEHYFCSTSVEQEIEQINITNIVEEHHSSLTEKNQIPKSNRNLVKIGATNKNISSKFPNPLINAVSPIGNEGDSSEKRYKKGKGKKQTESPVDSEHNFSSTVINNRTKEMPSISSENLCSISVEAEQLDVAENLENNGQNVVEENQHHKKSHKKNKKNKSPFMYGQTFTDINSSNNNNIFDSCAVEFISQEQKEKDKSSKNIPLETEKVTISNDSSSKIEGELNLNFHHDESSSVAVNDMSLDKLNDSNLLKTKRRRRRRRKKSSTIVADNSDVNLINTSKSYCDKNDENINRKHILYLSPDRNNRNNCLNDASEIHNPSTDTFVLNEDKFSSVPSDYPKMSTPIVILNNKFSSNESSVIVKNNLDVNTVSSTKPHSEIADEGDNMEDILYLSPKNQEISLNNASEIQNTSTDTFANGKDKFPAVSLRYLKVSTPVQSNSCDVPNQQDSLESSKNCNLSPNNNERMLYNQSTSKNTLQTNRKRKSKNISYEDLPDVISLPDVGTCIAYKVIELSENYTPTLTDYRVGVIERINLDTEEVEIRLNKEIILPGRVGKFENLKEGEVPEPIIKTHDFLKWSNVASPKLMSLIE